MEVRAFFGSSSVRRKKHRAKAKRRKEKKGTARSSSDYRVEQKLFAAWRDAVSPARHARPRWRFALVLERARRWRFGSVWQEQQNRNGMSIPGASSPAAESAAERMCFGERAMPMESVSAGRLARQHPTLLARDNQRASCHSTGGLGTQAASRTLPNGPQNSPG